MSYYRDVREYLKTLEENGKLVRVSEEQIVVRANDAAREMVSRAKGHTSIDFLERSRKA